MAITKIQSGAIPAEAIDTTHIGDVGADKITGQLVSSQITDLNVTHAKLHTTMDLSSKTVTLPTLSSLNITGNVGIGTTQPDLKLHVDGTNGYPASSGTTPVGHIAIRAKNESSTHGANIGVASVAPWGTWIQAQDAGNLATEYPLLLNPNGGNVGIGETSPLGKLHVKTADSGATADASADELVIEGSGNTGISILSGASNTGSIYFGDSGTNWDGYIAYNQSSRSMTFGVAAGGGTVNINSSGDVGIGTASPGRQLSIVDDGTNGQAIMEVIDSTNNNVAGIFLGRANNTNIGGMRYFHTDNYLALRSNDVDALIIDSSGKVGIGTETPNQLLEVSGNGAKSRFTRSGSAGTLVEYYYGSNPAGGMQVQSGGLGIGGAARENDIFIKTDGNVGIGTTNPSAKLHVEGTIYADNGTTVKSVTTVGTGVGGVPRQRFHRLINMGAGQQKVQLMRYGRHWWGVGWFEIIIRGTYYGGNSKYGVFTVNGHTRSGLASISSHINNSGTATPFAENYNSTHESCDISINLPGYEYYNIEYNIQHSYQQSAANDVGIHVGNSNAFFLYGTVEEFI